MSMNTQKTIKKSTFSTENDEFNELSTSALLARKSVPLLHRELANNYTLIKRIYKFQAVKSALTQADKVVLKEFGFAPLAEISIEEMNRELGIMRSMSADSDEKKRHDADELIKIRTKELKYIVASRYPALNSEINNGYMALERYFEEISRYYA